MPPKENLTMRPIKIDTRSRYFAYSWNWWSTRWSI